MKKVVFAALVVLAACRRQEMLAHLPAKSPAPRPAAKSSEGVDVGTAMPGYTAKWLDGTPFDLASEKGHVLLLNLWATWCGPCRYEIPELDKLHAKYEARGFKVIGVSVDEGGPADVKPFLKEQKISYPIAVDPEGKLATILHTSVLPTSVLLDRRGNVVWKHFGIVDLNDALLTRALEAALAQ